MVLSTLFQQWTQRLMALEEERSSRPIDERWLIGIRIKILRYLIARYGESVVVPVRDFTETKERTGGESSVARSAAASPIECLPRRGETMTPALDDIQEANRIANPWRDPEQVWSWWATHWVGARR